VTESIAIFWGHAQETAKIKSSAIFLFIMTITLPPELQTQLQTLADRRGKDLNTIVIELLAQSLNPNGPEALGYSRNFLDNVIGQWAGESLDRPTQMPSQPCEEIQWPIS
jgi:hypothetical protein